MHQKEKWLKERPESDAWSFGDCSPFGSRDISIYQRNVTLWIRLQYYLGGGGAPPGLLSKGCSDCLIVLKVAL